MKTNENLNNVDEELNEVLKRTQKKLARVKILKELQKTNPDYSIKDVENLLEKVENITSKFYYIDNVLIEHIANYKNDNGEEFAICLKNETIKDKDEDIQLVATILNKSKLSDIPEANLEELFKENKIGKIKSLDDFSKEYLLFELLKEAQSQEDTK